jgi:hypothetical protein
MCQEIPFSRAWMMHYQQSHFLAHPGLDELIPPHPLPSLNCCNSYLPDVPAQPARRAACSTVFSPPLCRQVGACLSTFPEAPTVRGPLALRCSDVPVPSSGQPFRGWRAGQRRREGAGRRRRDSRGGGGLPAVGLG